MSRVTPIALEFWRTRLSEREGRIYAPAQPSAGARPVAVAAQAGWPSDPIYDAELTTVQQGV